MKIKERNALFQLIREKIIKARKKVVLKIRNRFYGLSEENFQPFEVATTEISEKTIVPEKAFNAFISRMDVRKLNHKKVESFKFVEGKTTVAHILNFFFPPKKKRK